MPEDEFVDNPDEYIQQSPVSFIDWGRLIFAFTILFAMLGFLGFYFYLSVFTKDADAWARIKDAFQVILPTVTGVLGTVVAFYFGKARG
jgi:hypothetical protein